MQYSQKSITFAEQNHAIPLPRWRNGRRARFRCECREACRFESCSGHNISELTNWNSKSYLADFNFYVHITCKRCLPKSNLHSITLNYFSLGTPPPSKYFIAEFNCTRA